MGKNIFKNYYSTLIFEEWIIYFIDMLQVFNLLAGFGLMSYPAVGIGGGPLNNCPEHISLLL